MSKKKNANYFGMDLFQYYKFPIRQTLKRLYYEHPMHLPLDVLWEEPIQTDNLGEIVEELNNPMLKDIRAKMVEYETETSYFDELPILTEEQLQGEDKSWAKFAYGLTRGKAGTRLYAKVCGSSGFENVQPIAVLLTQQNAFVIVNFGWSSSPLGMGRARHSWLLSFPGN